jgi:hypothetical protein
VLICVKGFSQLHKWGVEKWPCGRRQGSAIKLALEVEFAEDTKLTKNFLCPLWPNSFRAFTPSWLILNLDCRMPLCLWPQGGAAGQTSFVHLYFDIVSYFVLRVSSLSAEAAAKAGLAKMEAKTKAEERFT